MVDDALRLSECAITVGLDGAWGIGTGGPRLTKAPEEAGPRAPKKYDCIEA